MLKQYRCTQCGTIKAYEEPLRRYEKIQCNNLRLVEEFDPVKCKGQMVEYINDLFPTNTEVMNMIAELSTQLTFSKIDNKNKDLEKNQALNDLAVMKDSLKRIQEKCETIQGIHKKSVASHGDIVEDYENKLDFESKKVIALSDKVDSLEVELKEAKKKTTKKKTKKKTVKKIAPAK